jgi:hypothetical protein
MAEEEPDETLEPETAPVIEITNLSSIAIQIHELYVELQKSGFKSKDALTLVGMVLSNTPTAELIDPYESFEDSGSGQILLMDSDVEVDDDDEEFGEWDKFFENPDPQ